MLTIAGGILIAVFIIWAILSVGESPTIDEYFSAGRWKRHPRYAVTIWGPRIIVFGVVTALLVILFKLI